jgi:hypothetical protein
MRAAKKALFFRATLMPSLASALTLVGDSDGDRVALPVFADLLESGLRRCLISAGIPIQQIRLLTPVDIRNCYQIS